VTESVVAAVLRAEQRALSRETAPTEAKLAASA
jgi:hypothetical protein